MRNIFEKRLNKGNPFIRKDEDKGDKSTEMNEEEIKAEKNEQSATETEETTETVEAKDSEESVAEEVNEVSEEVDEAEKLKEDFDNLNNQYLRLAADFENYRKRQAQEREELLKYGARECMTKVIEVVDNFDRALTMVEKIDSLDKMKETFVILNKQLIDSLTKLGLEQIKCEGEKFDPNLHEAVMQVPTDEYPEDTVMQEMQKGYKLGEKVLRPAMVSVAVKQG